MHDFSQFFVLLSSPLSFSHPFLLLPLYSSLFLCFSVFLVCNITILRKPSFIFQINAQKIRMTLAWHSLWSLAVIFAFEESHETCILFASSILNANTSNTDFRYFSESLNIRVENFHVPTELFRQLIIETFSPKILHYLNIDLFFLINRLIVRSLWKNRVEKWLAMW